MRALTPNACRAEVRTSKRAGAGGCYKALVPVLQQLVVEDLNDGRHVVLKCEQLKRNSEEPLAPGSVLMAATWDGSGDCLDPVGRVAIDRVQSHTPRKPPGLVAIRATLCLLPEPYGNDH